jgi:hypothetical protein
MIGAFDDSRLNVIGGVTLFFAVALLCGFFAALMGSSTAGEVAAALGSFVGGFIGAGGAVAAVYVALSSQRKEEPAKVSAAVRTEVASLTTYVIGSVEICEGIANGTQQIPSLDASYIMQKLWADPVIYPAVADRVGLLPHPNATTQFYMRLSEAKAMIQSLQIKTARIASISLAMAAQERVTSEFAATIAESLITALQLARAVIADDGQLSQWIGQEMVRQIDDCLQSAEKTFPNAESFKKPAQLA